MNKVLELCGFGGGCVTFDGEKLKGNASCEVCIGVCVDV